MSDQIEEFLQKMGLKPGAIDRMTLGRGVLANTAAGVIAIMAFAAAAVFALRGEPWLVLLAMGMAFGFTAWFLNWTAKITDKHPLASILGGTDFVRYHEIEQGAKGLVVLPKSPNIEPPAALGSPEA
jgi:hypothetical protein